MPKRHAILPVKDVSQQGFVRLLGHWLKKNKKIDLPDWVDVVKTGAFKELPPAHGDWLYQRMAAIMRRVYMREPSGVGALCRRFGGNNKRRGVRPNHRANGSRGLIRYCMHAAEKQGWMYKASRGRKMTRKGKQFMDEFSGRCSRSYMVRMYWQRRKGLTHLKALMRKEKWKARKIRNGLWEDRGDHAHQSKTKGGANALDQSYVGVETAQGNVEVVEEFE